jgi:hypothetical protein
MATASNLSVGLFGVPVGQDACNLLVPAVDATFSLSSASCCCCVGLITYSMRSTGNCVRPTVRRLHSAERSLVGGGSPAKPCARTQFRKTMTLLFIQRGIEVIERIADNSQCLNHTVCSFLHRVQPSDRVSATSLEQDAFRASLACDDAFFSTSSALSCSSVR